MDLEEALETINEELESEFRHHLEEGLPGAAYEDRMFDEQLIKEIARSIQRWKVRLKK